MSKSVLSNEHECFVCKSTYNLHRHHIYAGARRKKSEELGAWCYLCARHHNMSGVGVHNSHTLDLKLKRLCQTELEKRGMTREEFISTFGKNYKISE